MGGKKYSSKKKSSKKKRLKVSSKDRKRKNRRNKSKKLSSSEDYTSSSDYSSSPQASSSSSEDDYSRKSRRHSRDVNRVKKRTRRRSSSRDVSEGSPPAKKRKRSNKKSIDYGRKMQKKKRRRYATKSSDSRSCSSCQYGTTLEDDNFPSPGIKSRKKTKEKRIPVEPFIEKRSTSGEPRCSSCNDHACSCVTTDSGKGYPEENNPKRLRSVIIVPDKTHEKEGDEQGRDMVNEEMSNKHHDYPSSGNYDINDLEGKRKLASSSLSNQMTHVENLLSDDACPPNNEACGPKKTGGAIGPYNGDEGEISNNNANSGVEDLETLLRKKALENLQKFRKELQTSTKSGAKEKKKESDVNLSSPSKTEVVPSNPPEMENRKGWAVDQELGCISKLVTDEEFSDSTKNELVTPAGKNKRESEPAFTDETELGKLSCSTRDMVQPYTKENSFASKRNIIRTTVPLRSGVLSTDTTKKFSHSTKNELVTPAEKNNKRESEPALTGEAELSKLSCSNPLASGVLRTDTVDNIGMGADNASIGPTIETTSSVRSTSEISNNQPGETKDASQFENKTMSVMRGGEMVQVSYKVYIPKRAPALARRQLKR